MAIIKKKDLDEDQLTDLEDELEAQSESLKLSMYNSKGANKFSDAVDKFGLCKDCAGFQYIRFEFHGERAVCLYLEARLTGSQRIAECSQYNKKGQLSLQQMQSIAWIIDLGGRRVGF